MKMRMTRRGAGILIALMLIAVPAAAAVMTQNFVSATVQLNGPCFSMTAGADPSPGGFVEFSGDVVSTGSVDLVQEVITVNGFGGNRMIYSSVANLNNDCGDTVTVEYIPAADPGGAAAFEPAAGDPLWDDFEITFYIANTATPSDDVLGSGDWDVVLNVDGGTATTPANAVIPNGSSRTMAVVIDTDSSVTSLLPTPAIMRWTAQIVHP